MYDGRRMSCLCEVDGEAPDACGLNPIERTKPMANTLTDLVPTQTPEKLAGDFGFTEGPVWHPDRYLLFSDIPARRK